MHGLGMARTHLQGCCGRRLAWWLYCALGLQSCLLKGLLVQCMEQE